jgi:hypothetical protein
MDFIENDTYANLEGDRGTGQTKKKEPFFSDPKNHRSNECDCHVLPQLNLEF